jgi:hypothetical protein
MFHGSQKMAVRVAKLQASRDNLIKGCSRDNTQLP